MAEFAYLSRAGEVKIPLRLRTMLGLQPGEKLEVSVNDGALVLRRVALPSEDQVARFIAWTREHQQQGPRVVTIGGQAPSRRPKPKKARPRPKAKAKARRKR